MTTGAPRGGSMTGGGGGNYDPSVLFDLDDILMAGDCNEMTQSSLIHSPIKEEPEYEPDDNRYAMFTNKNGRVPFCRKRK